MKRTTFKSFIMKSLLTIFVFSICIMVDQSNREVQAGTTSITGSSTYGSWLYALSCNDNTHYQIGTSKNNGSVTRYCRVRVYLATSVTATPLSGSMESTSGDVAYTVVLSASKTQSSKPSGYRYCFKGEIYGAAYAPNVPVVETKYLNLID